MKTKCPGQDTRNWKPKDVYEIPCPSCGKAVEFFKDDLSRKCKHCGARFRNPRVDLACAEWCQYAAECIDFDVRDDEGE